MLMGGTSLHFDQTAIQAYIPMLPPFRAVNYFPYHPSLRRRALRETNMAFVADEAGRGRLVIRRGGRGQDPSNLSAAAKISCLGASSQYRPILGLYPILATNCGSVMVFARRACRPPFSSCVARPRSWRSLRRSLELAQSRSAYSP